MAVTNCGILIKWIACRFNVFQGFCQGNLIHFESVDDYDGCLSLCKNEPQCNWFNYNRVTNDCLLNSDCSAIDEGQTDFVTGERDCPLNSTGYKDIMIVAGYNFPDGGNLNDTEIVSLDETSTCMKPADYPVERCGMVGTFFNGKAFVCGGWVNVTTKDCFAYDFDSGVWTPDGKMGKRRAYASAVMLNDSHWWITGGENDSEFYNTTELYDLATKMFSPFIEMPVDTGAHVLLKLNETHFFLCCGAYMYGKSFILDLESELWMETPQSLFDHSRGFAGVVTASFLKTRLIYSALQG